MDQTIIKADVAIKAPLKKVFNYLTTPAMLPQIMPGLLETSNVPPLPLKKGSQYDYKYRMYGVTLEGKWNVTNIEEPHTYEGESTGGAESKWKYNLDPIDENHTHLTLTIVYVPPKNVVEKVKTAILERINQQSLNAYLNNLQAILEM